MASYLILAGGHAIKDAKDKLVHLSKGDSVESDSDLVERFGPEKFAYDDDYDRRRRSKKAKRKPVEEEEVFDPMDDGDEEEEQPVAKKPKRVKAKAKV